MTRSTALLGVGHAGIHAPDPAALAGVAIAAIGAWLPAQWTASRKVAAVLQSE